MRLLEVELGEERLVSLQVGPSIGVEGLFRRGEVPVGLGGAPEAETRGKMPEIGREIAGVAEPLGQQADARRKPVAVVAMRAMVVRADRRLVHPGHERRPAGRADRRRGVEPRVPHALGRQPVEVRRPDLLRPGAAELVAEVLGDQPEDVGPIGAPGHRRARRDREMRSDHRRRRECGRS